MFLIHSMQGIASAYMAEGFNKQTGSDHSGGRYLDPHVIASIGSLELRARMIVEGVMTGMHRSPYQGFSVEFAQHRQYAAGDDIRFVDWKVYGKTERLYLKQYHQETNLDLIVMLDTSESMGYAGQGRAIHVDDYKNAGVYKSGKSVDNFTIDNQVGNNIVRGGVSGGERDGFGLPTDDVDGRGKIAGGGVLGKVDKSKDVGWGKYDYGATLAAAMSYLALRQQDRVALSLLSEDEGKQVTRLSNKQGQWKTIIERLEYARTEVCKQASKSIARSETKQHNPISNAQDVETGMFDRVVSKLTRRSLVVLISDLYMDVEVMRDAMAKLSHKGHDLILIQVVDGDEEELLLRNGVELLGLEGEGKLMIDPKALREAYVREVRLHREALETAARGFGFDLLRVRRDEEFSGPLSYFLAKRGASIARGGTRC
ncbi:DUF58 domain-containing protein [Planctomycetota bacterium]|nr:DUF58 domain-containing protein [Planctomycetota bacterium]